MAAEPPTASSARQWRYDDLAHLLAAARAHKVNVRDFTDAMAVDSADIRRGWVAAVAAAADVDRAAAAEQARRALVERADETAVGDVWSLLTTPVPGPRPRPDASQLSVANRESLVAALDAASDWIAEGACRILWETTDDELSNMLLSRLDSYAPDRRYLVALLSCHCAASPLTAVSHLLDRTDPVQRVAGARVLRQLDRETPQVAALQDNVARDPNVSVRQAARRDDLPPTEGPAPSTWSCMSCAIVHPLTIMWCSSCGRHQPTL